jgi:molybdopterin-guanine dinucleotide biosynthesis protein A
VCHLIEGRQPLRAATSMGHHNQIEPLFTIYEPQIRNQLKQAMIENRLSLRALLSEMSTTVIEALDDSRLINANDPLNRQFVLQKLGSHPIKP